MKVQKNIKRSAQYLIIISMLVLLPGCRFVDWLKEKFGGSPSAPTTEVVAAEVVTPASDGSPVLATIGGKPLITQTMLDTEKQKLIAANPQMQAMIAMMDEKQLNRNLVDGMASREIIRKYVADHKLDTSEKYKKDFDMLLTQIRDALNTRYFMDAFSVEVADSEVKKFYDENKDAMPNLLISRGGIEAMAVPFADQKSANEFMAKVKENKNSINTAAKAAGLTDKVKDFKLVNEQSLGVDPQLRDKIVALTSVPSVNTFKVGNEYWVVAATKKEAPKYRPLDQVKEDISQMLQKEKMMKKFEDEVARLKGEYGVEIKEELFASPQAKMAQAALEQDADVVAPEVQTAQAASQKPQAKMA